jgi:uncharacterized membrane protein
MKLTPARLMQGVLLVGAVAAWAWLAHRSSLGEHNNGLAALAGMVFGIGPVILLLLMFLPKRQQSPRLHALGVAGLLGVAALLWSWLRLHVDLLYFLQSFGTNLMLAVFFGQTLRGTGEPLITRMARLVHQGVLSPLQVSHTRQSTWVWTVFFALNALVSLGLYLLAPREVWSTFANLFAAPLLLCMFVGEAIWRRLVLPPEDRPNLAQIIQVFRLSQQQHPLPAGPVSKS